MELGKNPIVICDRDYFPLLFSLRSSQPDLPFKLLDTEALIDRLSFRYQGNVIAPLLPLGMDYVSAKKYLRLLRLIPEAKELSFIKEALPEDAMEIDPLGEYELERASLYLLEMPEDKEIHSLLSKKGYGFKDISFGDLGIKPISNPNRNLIVFQNKYQQFSYLFSSLRERLRKKEITPEQVRIQVQGEGDAFYLRVLGKIYGVPVDYPLSQTLFSMPGFSQVLAEIYQSQNMDVDFDEKDENEGQVHALIEEYGLRKLPFKLAYACLVEILQAKSLKEESEGGAIFSTNRFVFSPESEIYLTCFQTGPFHNVYADEDVFPDAKLEELGVNPSYVKTRLEKRKKVNFLSFHRLALISRVKDHLDEKIYASQLEKELGFKEVPAPSYGAPNGMHTQASAKLFNMNIYDHNFVTSPVNVYRSYDPSFKGIPSYRVQKDHWSITNLEKYVSCPYAYYLNTVLPRESSDIRPAYCGTMVHKALEGVYDADYDMEAAILNGKKAYLDQREKEGQPALPYDDLLVELTASNIRRYVPLIRKQLEHMKVLETFNELKVSWIFADERGSYRFRGSIDSIVVVGDGSSRYYYVNDYKTGAEEFHAYEAFLGRSTQLPSYVYALTQGPFQQDHGGLFAGMGIKTVMFPSLSSAFKESKSKTLSWKEGLSSLATHGPFLNEANFWRVADDTAFSMKPNPENKKEKISVCSAKGSFLSPKEATFDGKGNGSLSGIKEARAYGLEELIEDTKKAVLATIHHIEAGEFPIAPSANDLREAPTSRNVTCAYCKHRDVCYRDLSVAKADYSGRVAAHFKKEEK